MKLSIFQHPDFALINAISPQAEDIHLQEYKQARFRQSILGGVSHGQPSFHVCSGSMV